MSFKTDLDSLLLALDLKSVVSEEEATADNELWPSPSTTSRIQSQSLHVARGVLPNGIEYRIDYTAPGAPLLGYFTRSDARTMSAVGTYIKEEFDDVMLVLRGPPPALLTAVHGLVSHGQWSERYCNSWTQYRDYAERFLKERKGSTGRSGRSLASGDMIADAEFWSNALRREVHAEFADILRSEIRKTLSQSTYIKTQVSPGPTLEAPLSFDEGRTRLSPVQEVNEEETASAERTTLQRRLSSVLGVWKHTRN